jgi:hypothetical protein
LEDENMGPAVGVHFDPETIELLKEVLEKAWNALPASRKRTVQKTELAERILAAAGRGERDPDRLRVIALMRPMVPAGTLQPSQNALVV